MESIYNITSSQGAGITIDVFEEFVGCTVRYITLCVCIKYTLLYIQYLLKDTNLVLVPNYKDTIIEKIDKKIFSDGKGTNPYTPDSDKIYHGQCGICGAEECSGGKCDVDNNRCLKGYVYDPQKSTCGIVDGTTVYSIGEASVCKVDVGGVYLLNVDRENSANTCDIKEYKFTYGDDVEDSCDLAVTENDDGTFGSGTTIYLVETTYAGSGFGQVFLKAFLSATDRESYCAQWKKNLPANVFGGSCQYSQLRFWFSSWIDPDCRNDNDMDGFSDRYYKDFGDTRGPAQLQVPISIDSSSNTAIDIHGKFMSIFLDEVFEYKRIGNPGLFKQDNRGFSDNLKKIFQTLIEDETSSILTELDASVALLFGNKTTIGQVCAYAKGLDDDKVDDVPGFCCLDAPYQSNDWGEKVRMIYIYI